MWLDTTLRSLYTGPMATTTYDNYAETLEAITHLAYRAAGVEGADDVGAFHAIRKTGTNTHNQFSSLSEWLDDVADTLRDFIADERDEIETWDAR